jgi:hypothetical protein
MGIDAVAVLRIRRLPAPKLGGVKLFVQHVGDCTLVHTMERFDSMAPDEHSLSLRKLVGDALDRHDDPRGILFFNDAYEAHGESYDEIVDEIGLDGEESASEGAFWAPKVSDDHVPEAITNAEPGSMGELVAKAMKKLGAKKGMELVQFASLMYPSKVTREPGKAGADRLASYRKQTAKLRAAMGPEFMEALEAGLDASMEAYEAAQRTRFDNIRPSVPTPAPAKKRTAKKAPAKKKKRARA